VIKLVFIQKNLLVLFCLFFTCTEAVSQVAIRYPKAGPVYKSHHAYPLALLKMSVSKTEGELRLEPSEIFMNQGRAIKQLEANRDIDILWTMTSEDREKELQAIRVPIYKGLIGWRVFLMNSSPKVDLSRPIPLTQLKKLAIIQGHDWPDTSILQHNLFNVHSGPSYEGLFKILQYGRADLFPRSIIEVWDELKIHESSKLQLEQHTLINYPTASYFFVSKLNTQLAKKIGAGLQMALDDGSFDTLFQRHFSEKIQQAKLGSRKQYRLLNPLLPEATPIENSQLWFKP